MYEGFLKELITLFKTLSDIINWYNLKPNYLGQL